MAQQQQTDGDIVICSLDERNDWEGLVGAYDCGKLRECSATATAAAARGTQHARHYVKHNTRDR